MASFKFNFSGENDEVQTHNEEKNTEEIQWLSCEEIIPKLNIKELDELIHHAKMFTCGDVEIGHVLINDMYTHIKEEGLQNIINLAEKEHSDLVTGKYEGGLKIWECTYDLVEYLENQSEEISFKDMRVLDLGCGAGILGIYAFLKGALVTFQDYNKEILQHSTIINVLLNIEEAEKGHEIKNCKFYSGDWASFDKLLTSEKYDIILTSETIYNQENYDKLINFLQNRLTANGVVFVAAKTYYFGVGGGTRQFESAIEKSALKSEVVWNTTSGIQREIIKIIKR